MSRHKIIKNLDLDEELVDYDGGYDDYEYVYTDDVEDFTEEDEEQMAAGTLAVRSALGPDVPGITDGEIRDTLWHYYYDVSKTVARLLDSRIDKNSMNGMNGENNKNGSPKPSNGFWADMPWFNIPVDRQTTFIASTTVGGLLGGGSEAPKMSKLQALAAARKKKALEDKSNLETGVENVKANSMAGVDTGQSSQSRAPPNPSSAAIIANGGKARTYAELKRESSSSAKKRPQLAEIIGQKSPEHERDQSLSSAIEFAKPSAFAGTIFGSRNGASFLSLPSVFRLFLYSTDAFAGPSPDDVVIAAQSKAPVAASKTTKGAANKPGGERNSDQNADQNADQIADGLETLKMDDGPKAKRQDLDVLAEFKKERTKKAANFVVIGHVDAGKSTLMGRLLYDLNFVAQRTIDKYRKEAEKMGKSSFALAWVLDQGTEERIRGITMDIATNKFETENTTFTILDAPGHRDFIPNMIAGASQADFAVLVIDASTGSFESGLRGQTKEHALLVRSLGVQRLIVAINKLDTVGWSQDRFTEISQQVSAFLAAASYQDKNISFIPVSGLNGDNIVRRSAEPTSAWYTGPTLLEELENSEPVGRALEYPLRLTIGDVFRGGVQNPLSISGRIEAGSLQLGDALLVQPSAEQCYIKGIEMDGKIVDWAVAGQNVVVHLSNIDAARLRVGDVLCHPTSAIVPVRDVTVKALAFEFLTPMAVDLYRGRLHVAGKIKEMVALLDKGTGTITKKKPKIVKPGGITRLRLLLEKDVPLESGARVVLRSGGETVAAGLLE